jgi:hypothetical protein
LLGVGKRMVEGDTVERGGEFWNEIEHDFLRSVTKCSFTVSTNTVEPLSQNNAGDCVALLRFNSVPYFFSLHAAASSTL